MNFRNRGEPAPRVISEAIPRPAVTEEVTVGGAAWMARPRLWIDRVRMFADAQVAGLFSQTEQHPGRTLLGSLLLGFALGLFVQRLAAARMWRR